MPPTLTHGYIVCADTSKKMAGLRRFLKRLPAKKLKNKEEDAAPIKVLVFCEERRPMEDMARVLLEDLAAVVATTPVVTVLRLEDSLTGRAAAMDAFRGETLDTDDDDVPRVLLSTDLAARGLDVRDISHVVHFDLPNDGDTYVHRGGRAGRMGRKGTVVSLISDGQEFVLERLANKLGLEVTCLARQKKKKTAAGAAAAAGKRINK